MRSNRWLCDRMSKVIVFTSNDLFAGWALKKSVESYPECFTSFFYAKDPLSTFKKRMSIARDSGFQYISYQAFNKIFIKTFIQFLSKFHRFKHPFVSQLAKQHNIKILEVDKINSKDVREYLSSLAPDLILSIQFPQIVKEIILRVPRFGAVNIHKAILPRNRGMNPIFWAMLNGENETGISAHFMERSIDSGEIIDQRSIPISPSDSLFSLTYKCADLASDIIYDLVSKVINGKELSSFPQNKQKASYFSIPKKKDIKEFKKKKLKFLF